MAKDKPTNNTRMELMATMANVRIIFGMRAILTTPTQTMARNHTEDTGILHGHYW